MSRGGWGARLLPFVLAACVPADEAIGLGSVQFTLMASARTEGGIPLDELADGYGYAVTFDRVVLGFKTMTIGKIGLEDVCSYRGRGALENVVLDPRHGVAQTFNGIHPVDCPDVGIIFGPPDGATTLGPAIVASDAIELATGSPAHALVDVTATRSDSGLGLGESRLPLTFRIKLRFGSLVTATRFGGCRAARRGVQIVAAQRDVVAVRFAAENLLRDAISGTARLRLEPFLDADERGDGDGIATMEELDALPLATVDASPFYQLPNGTRAGSFGDYVRALFRFSVMFRDEQGLCVGNEPGSEDD